MDPVVLNRLSGLELKARKIVEGFVSGMHESPYKGVSVEFAQHREYVPGDDPRHLDWKVFARSDRLYVKEYEQETNLRSTIVVDFSSSMEYGSGYVSKIDYARYVAASLAYFIIHQRDSVKLITFHEDIAHELPASNSTAHLRSIIRILEDTPLVERTNLEQVLTKVSDRLQHRGLTILISDLLDDFDDLMKGLQRIHHQGHDLLILQILDHHEKEFPLSEMTQFLGLESDEELILDPKALREAYLEEINDHLKKIRDQCRANKIDHQLITTNENLSTALSTYLAKREGRLEN